MESILGRDLSAEGCVLKLMLGDRILTEDCPQASISNVKHITSYNFLSPSVVAVPGSPPLWTGTGKEVFLFKHKQLKKRLATLEDETPDTDRKIAYYGLKWKYRYEALLRAVAIESPSFDIGSIDLVCDSSMLLSLLNYCGVFQPWQGRVVYADLELIGQTVFMSRRRGNLNNASESIPPPKGNGAQYEKVSTQGHRGYGPHYRAISYRLGSLNLLTHYETDAFSASAVPGMFDAHVDHGPICEDSSHMTGSCTVAAAQLPSHNSTTDQILAIRREGQTIPPEYLVEIKTANKLERSKTSMTRSIPGAWFTQVPTLVLARHRRGNFDVPHIIDMQAKIDRWQSRYQRVINRFAVLLAKIVSVARTHQRVTLGFSKVSGQLLIYENDQLVDMVPEDLRSLWSQERETSDSTEKPRTPQKDEDHLAQTKDQAVATRSRKTSSRTTPRGKNNASTAEPGESGDAGTSRLGGQAEGRLEREAQSARLEDAQAEPKSRHLKATGLGEDALNAQIKILASQIGDIANQQSGAAATGKRGSQSDGDRSKFNKYVFQKACQLKEAYDLISSALSKQGQEVCELKDARKLVQRVWRRLLRRIVAGGGPRFPRIVTESATRKVDDGETAARRACKSARRTQEELSRLRLRNKSFRLRLRDKSFRSSSQAFNDRPSEAVSKTRDASIDFDGSEHRARQSKADSVTSDALSRFTRSRNRRREVETTEVDSYIESTDSKSD